MTNEVWKYIANENKIDYATYKKDSIKLDSSIYELEKTIKIGKNNKKLIIDEIRTLQSKTTSVTHTVNEINKILNNFGFSSFKLTEVKNRGFYKIVRENGENARRTMSEGEKSFISFLYFYYLLKGSNSKEDINLDKIVVIDDPVVNLDNNVSLIVKKLIRKLSKDIENKTGNVKQLFVLTHNIQFYKEVSFNRKWEKDFKTNSQSFFVLRKENKNTRLKAYTYNPIKSSYELLWEDLKSSSNISYENIKNIMKRIIEKYFKSLGGLKYDSLMKNFESEEQNICRELFSWLDEELYLTDNYLYIENEPEIIEKCKNVFKKIFILSGNEFHYNMMME